MKTNSNRALRTADVRDLMTEHVFTLQPTDDLEALYDLMETHHVRHVPVVDRGGDIVGLVTQRDLAQDGGADAPGEQDRVPAGGGRGAPRGGFSRNRISSANTWRAAPSAVGQGQSRPSSYSS